MFISTGIRPQVCELVQVFPKPPLCQNIIRGMGDSVLAPNDHITIESLARDLLFLLESLRWKELAICGYSMGGMCVQMISISPSKSK